MADYMGVIVERRRHAAIASVMVLSGHRDPPELLFGLDDDGSFGPRNDEEIIRSVTEQDSV